MKINAHIKRDKNGIPHIDGKTENDLYEGLGYCHALDRGIQMLLMRILGQGRISEFLDSSDKMLPFDIFFRRMNWSGETVQQINKLSPKTQSICDSYCNGINKVFKKTYPWEFKLLGYKPEPWQIEDSMMISRMIGYLTLAQSQGDMERLFIEMAQAGINREKLDELFPGILDGLDIELIKKINLQERIVPPQILWNIALPRMMASNNWVISGKKTASGRPILANDPHLETNRLPNVWYETALKTGNRYSIGASMPGLPGVLIGRTNDIAWGATYTFMDTIDSWIENCKDGKYLRYDDSQSTVSSGQSAVGTEDSAECGVRSAECRDKIPCLPNSEIRNNQWLPFRQRKEKITRKKKSPAEVIFYENEHGVLDGDPNKEGYYLSTLWTGTHSGAASVETILKMRDARNVEEGMNIIGRLETAWNWVLADKEGNIGYQMSGLMPQRRKDISGFVPLPGWEKENDWAGYVSYKDLPRSYNPDSGFFVTANQDLNNFGKENPINISMGDYRAKRIAHLLSQGQNFTPKDIFKLHFDVYSLQAETYMKILKPFLPNTKQGSILRNWDCCYSPDSEGAYLFETFYKKLFEEVFGKNGFGNLVTKYLSEETGIFVDFYSNFDKILLSEKSEWFGEKERDAVYSSVLEEALKVSPRKWREVQQFTLTNILFAGKLPLFLGFDRGPITLRGGRATIHQGQIYKSAGRTTTFAPSFRMVTDFAKDEIYTNIAGGPSDRRFSKWYCSDLYNWLIGKYKIITP